MSFARGTCAVGLAVAMATAAQADGLKFSTMNRTELFRSQTRVLDLRAQSQNGAKIALQPSYLASLSNIAPSFDGTYKGPYLSMARAAARRHGVPEDLFLRLVQKESNWRATAKSHKGAFGLAQLMPATARAMGVEIGDPADNLMGGARYLRLQYDKFGTWRLALAAYNAGPDAVEKYDGVPPYRETLDYVRVIWGS